MSAKQRSEGGEWVRKTPVGDLVDTRTEVWFANTDDLASKGIELILRHRVQSIPLFSKKARKFVAFMDLTDVVYFASKVLDKSDLVRGKAQGFLSIVNAANSMENATCAEVTVRVNDDIFLEIERSVTLRDVIAAMVRSAFIFLRIPVVNQEGKLIGIVSQSRIVREAYKHIDTFSFARLTIKDIWDKCHYVTKDIGAVKVSDTIVDALSIIRKKQVYAVAVVDTQGKLVGNFSSTDITSKRFTQDLTALIGMHLKEFLEQVKKPEDFSYPVAVTTAATLEEVFACFIHSGVHRVYIVDSQQTPIAIISTENLMRLILDEADGVAILEDEQNILHS